MKHKFRYLFYLLVIPIIIILLDQYTKTLVRQSLALGESITPFDALPFVRILHWYNTGVAFGLFQGGGIIFILLPIIILIGIIVYFPRIPDNEWSLRLALSLQFAGAVGNLIDRITIGHVTDFISISSFPVYNVADSSITVGVVVMLLGVWIQEKRDKAAREASSANQSETDNTLTEFRELS